MKIVRTVSDGIHPNITAQTFRGAVMMGSINPITKKTPTERAKIKARRKQKSRR